MRIIKAGATSQSIYVEILDSTSTTGGRKTGLVYNSAGLTAYYALVGASAVQITLATLAAANSAWSSGGFKEVDATNMPGVYRLDVPNAALASGPGVVITLKGATGMVQVSVEIQLVAIDLQDAVRLGLTALPNAAAEAAGGLYTRGSGAGQINQPANGQIDANAVKLGGTTQTGRDIGASVLLSSGTGTGQLDFTSGVVKANLAQILGTALTETAGQIAAAFKQFFDVASPTGTMKAITNVVTTTNLTNLPAITSNWLTAAGIAAGALNGKGDWNIGKTGYALSSAGVQAIWDALTSALTTVGSIGKRLVDYLTGDIYARIGAPVGASISADIAAVQADTDNIQTRIPAALVGGKMDADMTSISGDSVAADNLEKEYDGTGYGHVLQRTTIATLASQISFTLTAGSADNDAYNGCVIVIEDATTAAQKAVGVVGDYTGASKTIALLNDPAIFTMAVGDIVTLIADRAIKATVDNRTLDVSATGEAGLDWANIGSPTTVQTLSGTTIKTATDVEADTQDIQSRLPAALTAGGNMKSDMLALGGGTQSATDLKDFADDGYDPATNKVQGVVLVDTTTTLTNAPSDSSGVTTLLSRLSAVRAGYLDNLSAGAVALEASVQSVLSKLLKYVQLILRKDAAIATDNATEVTAINANGGSGGGAFANTTDSQEALRDRGDAAWITATGFSTLSQADVRTAIGLASANLDTQLDALPTAAENADAVWNEDATAHQTQGTFGQAIGDPGADTDTIFGLVNTNLNATISSRSSQASVDDLPTNAELATALAAADDAVLAAIASLSIPTAAANADAVWDEALSGHLGAGSAGEALSAAGSAGDPWSTALPGAYGAGTAGKIIGDNLNATISSRSTQTSVDDLPTNAELATALAAADDAVLAAIAALNNISQADVRTAVGLASANLDTQLAALPTAAENADAIWDEEATGHQTQGTFGQAIGDPGADTDTIFGLVNTNLNATVSSRASQTSVDDLPTNSELATALAAADDAILAAIALLNDLSEADVRTAVGLASANLDTQLGTLPTAAENADAVWDEALADHLGAGSTGEALNAAGAAGDPWSTALPGAYGAGTAGKIIGENLNATVSSRATQISVDDLPTNAELATALAAADDAILAAIAALNDLSAAEVTAAVPTAVQNADALLKRDWNSVSGEATRSALNALRFIRNRFSTVVTPGSVTVYKEDDTTVAFTKSLTTDAAAEPIVEG